MAKRLVPSRQALDEMNDSRNRKATQLATTYSNMGGTNTALVPNFAQNNPTSASIPVLERAVLDKANELQNQSRRLMPNRETQIDTSNVSPLDAFLHGATGLGRASAQNTLQQNANAINEVRNDRTERILNSIGQTSLAPLTDGTVMGVSVGNGGLTPEMRQAGLTQADLDLFNSTQSEREVGKASRQIAEDHPVLSTLGAVAVNPISAATNVTRNLDNYIRGNALQNYVNPATEMRQTVSEGIDSGVGRFAYNVGNSAADMLTAMLMPGSAAGTMGLEKASEVINGAVDRGLTPDQILAEGIGSGVTTAATEAIPLGRFSQGGNVFGAMLAEGLQEGAEDYADTILDQLVTRLGGNVDKSELALQLKGYIDAGYSPDDAVKAVMLDYNKQVGLDILAGGITGGLMGAGSNVIQGRNVITGRERTNNQNIVDDIKSDVENLKDNVTEEAYNTLIDKIDDAAEQHPELIPQLKEIVSEMETLPNSIRNEIAAQNAQTIPNLMLEEQAVQDRRNEEQALLEQGMQMRNQEINAIAEEITAEKNRVLDAIENNDPLSGEEIYNFAKYIDYMSRQNPDMAGYLNAELNDVLGMSGNWLTDFDNATVEIPTVLPEDARAEVQTTENGAVIDQANSIINTFAQDIQNGVDRQTAYRGVIGELTNLGNAYPNVRAELNNLVRNRLNPLMANPTNEVGDIPTVQNESVQPEVQSDRLTRRQITEYRSQRDAIKSNLAMFKGTKKLQNRLDKAFSAIEQNQPNAVENFNNVVNEINEEMAGETVGVSQRDVMSDLYRDMKEVTDGYKIRVSKDAIRQLGLSSDTYNELKNRLYTGKNSITFVEKGGTPIDSAYMEMYDQAHGSLPSPQNMAEGDLLKALYKYITDAKSSRGETTMETAWEDIPVNATTPLNRGQDLINGFYNKMRSGKATGIDTYDLQEKILDIIKQNPEYREELAELCDRAINDYWNNGLDADVKNIQTGEQAVQALEREADNVDRSLAMKLNMFSEKADADEDIDGRSNEAREEIHSGKFKTSKLSTRTIPNSGIVTDEEFEDNDKFKDEDKDYETVTHELSYNAAKKRIKDMGYTQATDAILNSEGQEWGADDTDTAMLCFKKATEDARNAEALGIDTKQAWKKAGEIFLAIRKHATKGGQAIEALKKWSMRTPEGKLAQALAYANQAEGEENNNDNLLSDLSDAAKDNKIKFSDEFIQEFLEKAHSLDDKNPTNAQQARLNVELAHMVLSQVPKKFRHKFTAFWMDNLLASARTLVSRNIGGNAGKFALDQTITKAISGPIDKLASKLTGVRTTTGFTRQGFKAGLKGAARSFSNTTKGYWFSDADPEARLRDLVKDFKTFRENFNLSGDAKINNRPGKGEENFLDLIRNNRSPFNNKGIEKAFKIYDKVIKYGLAISDDPFYGFVYEQTLNELNQIRNDPEKYGDAFSKMSDEQFETWAKATATAKGLEAVYQNDSKMSKGATAIKNGIGQMTEDMLGVDILSNPLFPFVRTPMNVIRTNLEYSPLGIVRNVINTVKEINTNLKHGRNAFDVKSFDQVRFVRETSRNLVGLLTFGAGLLMANGGLLTGGYSDNKKEKQAQQESGMQEYAFVNPLNGNQYSIDWIPGLGSSLISASAFNDAYNRPDQTVGEALGSGLREGSESLFEMSALQGLQRLTGSGYNSDKNVVDNAIQSLANTASSAVVPAFVRQLAQATDPYKRDTYSGDDKEDLLANLKNNIPILRETLQPRIGSNGEPLPQNPGRNFAQKLFDNLLNPAAVTVPSAMNDPVRDEAVRLHDEAGLYGGFQPKIERDYLEVNGHETTAEELNEFAANANTAMNQAARNLIDTDYYQSLTDEQKDKILSDIYKYVREGERTELLGLDPDDLDGAARAYYDDGEEGLLNYLTAGSMLAEMDVSNEEKYREAVLNTIDGMDADEIDELIDDYETRRDRAVRQTNDLLSDFYSGMSEDKAEDIQRNVYTAIRSVEMYQALGMDASSLDGAAKAYLNGGVQGIRDYFYAKDALGQMGMTNNPSNRDRVIEVLNEGGEDAVQQMISDSQALTAAGFSENMTYRYNHAQNYIPTLNPQSYYELFTAIDTEDPEKESIKQSELLDYLNRNPRAYDYDTVMSYWLAFGPSNPWGTQPYFDENSGTWKSRRS